MAVLVEAISVVVRRTAIAGQLHGGRVAFIGFVPNQTLCADEARSMSYRDRGLYHYPRTPRKALKYIR